MYGLWLYQIPGMTPAKIRKIYESCSSAEELYFLRDEVILDKLGLNEADAKRIVESKRKDHPEAAWIKLQEKGIEFLCRDDDRFPRKLLQIYDPPYALYVKGRLPDPKKKTVAIVGARECSAYGSQMAYQLGRELAKKSVATISGMARGVDGSGHRGTIDGKGETYAVLGCGVDVCYPKQSHDLYEHIPQNGGILSEYPPGTAPKNVHFPQRNRIISGLSDYVVVIEAKKKSGSLITADFAMEQGREVYALPGRVCDPLSQGCNELIRQGAGILTGIEDFLSDLCLIDNHPGMQMDLQKFLLEKDESLVYSLLDFAPLGIGTLTQQCPFGLMSVLDILGRLEQKGFVEEVIPNYYIKKV